MLEVAAGEEIFQGGLNALHGIDLSLLEALLEVFGGEVDVDDLVGLGEDGIGQALAHFYADEVLHHVVEAFEMLDVEGRNHVYSCGDDVLDVLVSLGVFAAGDVGMGELIDDGDRGVSGDDGIHIHFLNDDLVIFDLSAGDDFKAFEEAGGFGAAVGFDEANDDVDPFVFKAVRFLQHAESFSDAGAVTEIDLEPPPLGACGSSGGKIVLCHQPFATGGFCLSKLKRYRGVGVWQLAPLPRSACLHPNAAVWTLIKTPTHPSDSLNRSLLRPLIPSPGTPGEG